MTAVDAQYIGGFTYAEQEAYLKRKDETGFAYPLLDKAMEGFEKRFLDDIEAIIFGEQ